MMIKIKNEGKVLFINSSLKNTAMRTKETLEMFIFIFILKSHGKAYFKFKFISFYGDSFLTLPPR